MQWLGKPGMIWTAVGLIGQTVFAGRFYVQWIASERAKKSIVPKSFWYLSIIGSFILLVYAIYRQDIVFIIGQATGSSIYFRNLALLKREKAEGNSAAA